MAAKKFFTGPEMENLSGPLSGAETKLVVTSFRIAARVANAAWGFLQALDARNALMKHAREQELRDALRDYSPGNWPMAPSASHREYASHKLQQFYAEAEALHTKEEILECLYHFISMEHDE